MTCARLRQMLDAWIDQELDPQTSAALSRHCAHCASCAMLKAQRETTRDLVRELAPRYPLPSKFREDLVGTLRRAGQVPPRLVSMRRAWSMAAAGALAGSLAMFLLLQFPRHDLAAELAVARHVAGLASGHVVQIESGDRHAVKPWFQGKVGFAPPVRDLSSDGFTLVGARLDRIGTQAAAAVVYRIRNHPIEIYAWPGEAGQPTPLQVTMHRGFGVALWSAHGLRFAVVSDVGRRDLERFALLIRSYP